MCVPFSIPCSSLLFLNSLLVAYIVEFVESENAIHKFLSRERFCCFVVLFCCVVCWYKEHSCRSCLTVPFGQLNVPLPNFSVKMLYIHRREGRRRSKGYWKSWRVRKHCFYSSVHLGTYVTVCTFVGLKTATVEQQKEKEVGMQNL